MNEIRFSQTLLKHLPTYLGKSARTMVSEAGFPYSLVYYYKICDGSNLITDNVQKQMNEYWKSKGLNQSDLDNLYKLADLIEQGKQKSK